MRQQVAAFNALRRKNKPARRASQDRWKGRVERSGGGAAGVAGRRACPT